MASPVPTPTPNDPPNPTSNTPSPASHAEKWHVLRFEPAGRTVRVPVGTTLLEAARLVDQPIARGCGADGRCGRCGITVLDGRVGAEGEHETRVKERNRIDPALRLACRIEVEDDLVVTAPYW